MRLILSLALAVFFAAPAMAQNAPGDAGRGKALFMREGCYTCHGTTGAGGGGLGGPRLAHASLNAAAILQELRHPRAVMPAYTEKVLTDGEVADIAAFIQSLSREPARPAQDIPLLNR